MNLPHFPYKNIREQKEGDEKPLSRFEISMLKAIDDEKKEVKLKKDLIERIEEILPVTGKSPELALYFYELYKLNYREDGAYEKITFRDFVDPKHSKQKYTPNPQAWNRVIAKLPFRGSNLEGYWRNDAKGNPIYIIISYQWFPIFIYRNGVWYEVTDRYSSSTGRQMAHVSPNGWRREIKHETFLLTPNEMKQVIGGVSHEDLIKQKMEKLVGEKENLTKRAGWKKTWDHGEFIIRYKITDVKKEDDKVVVNVDVNDVALPRQPRFNYLTSDGPINKEKVEKRLEQILLNKLKNYAGQIGNWSQPKSYIIKFELNHKKKV